MAAGSGQDDGSTRIWVLSEQWCSSQEYSPFRWFTDLDAAVAWIEANPPQQYQDFYLGSVESDGLPNPDWQEERLQEEHGWMFPGEIGDFMDCPEWAPGKPYPTWDGVSRNRSVVPPIRVSE